MHLPIIQVKNMLKRNWQHGPKRNWLDRLIPKVALLETIIVFQPPLCLDFHAH